MSAPRTQIPPQIQMAIVPIDLATGANNGDWVNLQKYGGVTVVLAADAGTAGQDPEFKLQQATDNAGAGAKDLNFDTIYEKIGTQTGIGQYTKVSQTAATSYTNAASGEAENLIAVHISEDQLDIANGFTHLRLEVADTGATAGKFGCGLYIFDNPEHDVDGDQLESAID